MTNTNIVLTMKMVERSLSKKTDKKKKVLYCCKLDLSEHVKYNKTVKIKYSAIKKKKKKR